MHNKARLDELKGIASWRQLLSFRGNVHDFVMKLVKNENAWPTVMVEWLLVFRFKRNFEDSDLVVLK